MPNYASPRRRQQAENTRRDIQDAARRLFAERGYGPTSMADIASEAGVAIQTIYASCGTKRDILFALFRVMEEDADVPRLAALAYNATEPGDVIALGVQITRQLNERNHDVLAVMRSAAAVEAEAAAVYEDGFELHRTGTANLAARIAHLGALRPGTTQDDAAAVISVLTWADSYALLHDRYGWSYDRCQEWLTRTLIELTISGPDLPR